MWLVPAIFAVLALFAAGCSRTVFPGDGRLVIVEIDPALDACIATNGNTIGYAVRTASRYWDQAGARLRTSDQLLASEMDEAAKAPRLHIRGDACPTPGQKRDLTNDQTAEFNYLSGEIMLYVTRWADNWPLMESATVIAHEMGHAIGLDHVPDRDAIMCKDPYSRTDLALGDLREHARVWP